MTDFSLDTHRAAGAAIAERRYAACGGVVDTVEEADEIWRQVQMSLALGVRTVHMANGIDDPEADRAGLVAALEGFADRARELAAMGLPANDDDET